MLTVVFGVPQPVGCVIEGEGEDQDDAERPLGQGEDEVDGDEGDAGLDPEAAALGSYGPVARRPMYCRARSMALIGAVICPRGRGGPKRA
ncbi:MAG: hypothetical protein PVS3B2_11050 [Candidatus Dormibacteraceae bacterium]